jgi:hypothetical protein
LPGPCCVRRDSLREGGYVPNSLREGGYVPDSLREGGYVTDVRHAPEQVVEACEQLAGTATAGGRQVPDCRRAVVYGNGGVAPPALPLP